MYGNMSQTFLVSLWSRFTKFVWALLLTVSDSMSVNTSCCSLFLWFWNINLFNITVTMGFSLNELLRVRRKSGQGRGLAGFFISISKSCLIWAIISSRQKIIVVIVELNQLFWRTTLCYTGLCSNCSEMHCCVLLPNWWTVIAYIGNWSEKLIYAGVEKINWGNHHPIDF